MFTLIKNFFGGLFGAVTSPSGGTSIVGKALDIASEKVLDQDKLVQIIGDVVKQQIAAENNPTWTTVIADTANASAGVRVAVAAYIWGDVAHKLARTGLWVLVVLAYIIEPNMDVNTLMTLAAGPALYTIIKGSGRR